MALWYDLRFALRMLLKNPVFTLIAVTTLALGIGANSAIFSVINAVLLRPLPFKAPERLVWVWETQPNLDRAPFTPADFLDYKAQNRSFEEVATYFSQSPTLTQAGEPERLKGVIVSANFFSTLGAEALLGRTFTPEEGRPGAQRVAVISHGLWQRRFNSDRNILGRALTLNGVSFTVIGVMPPSFRYPNDAVEVWVNPQAELPELSIGSTDDVRSIRNSHWLPMIARLRPGVTIEQAQADMESIAHRLGQQYNSTHGVRVVSLHERIVGDVRPTLLVLLATVSLILLIACANVANLLLARAASRQREFAIRVAHGAGRVRLVQQLLTESLLLAAIGCGAGMLLAYWGGSFLTSMLPSDLPRVKEISLDWQVLGFTLAVSLLTGVVFGLAPALRTSKVVPGESLKEGSRGSTESLRRNRVRSLLVVFEVALALVILIGASLLVRSFLRLQNVELGFNPTKLLTLQISLPAAKYDDDAKQRAFFQALTERLERLPGGQGVAVSNDFPLEGDAQTSTPNIEGHVIPPGDTPLAGVHTVSHNYFRVMGIPLLKGRAFAPSDTEGSQQVIIINSTMMQRLFPGEDPIGKRIRFSTDPGVAWKEVVGVVGDVKHDELSAPPSMETYIPYVQSPQSKLAVALRTTSEPTGLTATVRNAVLGIDPDQPIYDIKAMEQRLSESVAPRRLSMTLFACSACIALVLAAVGVYGVMSYSVSRRTHEMGIRMALGAQSTNVVWLILRQGMVLAVTGIAIGALAAFAATRFMSSLLYDVRPNDPVTFIGVSLILISVSLLSIYIPARRATKVDPMIALRSG